MRAFFRACAERGLDVHGHCTVEAYNGAVQEVYRMPTRLPSARILLVGNSAALWPHVDRFARQRGCRHPVQEYVEETVLACLRDAYGKDESRLVLEVRFSHTPPPRRVAIQKLAECCGVARIDAATHHSIHPRFGPWISLRAAIVIDADGMDEEEETQESLDSIPFFSVAIPGPGAEAKDWLAVRKAIPLGQSHQFSEEQIGWHYFLQKPKGWQ